MVGLVLPLLLGSLCADPPAVEQRLKSAEAQGTEALGEVQRELEGQLGQPLGPAGEPASAGELRARVKDACALWEQSRSRAVRAVDRPLLEEILSRPEFANARDRSDDWELRFWRWLGELLGSSGAQGFSMASRTFVLALVVLALLAGAWTLWRRRRPWRRTAKGTNAASAPEPLRLEPAAVHLERAREALTQEPREAIREGLLGLLSALERERLARPDRVRTNRELALDLPRRGAPPAVTEQVQALIRWYDETFYSLAAVPRTEAQRFVSEIAALEQRLGRTLAEARGAGR